MRMSDCRGTCGRSREPGAGGRAATTLAWRARSTTSQSGRTARDRQSSASRPTPTVSSTEFSSDGLPLLTPRRMSLSTLSSYTLIPPIPDIVFICISLYG